MSCLNSYVVVPCPMVPHARRKEDDGTNGLAHEVPMNHASCVLAGYVHTDYEI